MAGRKQKPYQASWGEIIPGLAHDTSGRWRVVSTGFRFSEADERRAIDRFRALQPDAVVRVDAPAASLETALSQMVRQQDSTEPNSGIPLPTVLWDRTANSVTRGYNLDPTVLWPWFREQLIANPLHVANMTGIPELANLARFELPKTPVKLATIWTYYERQNTSKDKSATRRIWNAMVNFTKAVTLADLTKERLHSYRESVENNPDIKSGGTKVFMFGKIKAVLSFAKKAHDIDAVQLAGALANCGVLWTASPVPEYNPVPIDRDHLHTLLKAAGTGQWRAWILLGLNSATYLEELCDLEWKHVNLEAGTLSMRRPKTKFPRAATLWPETVEALKSLRRGPVYVFTSPHGTKFQSSNSRCNEFAKLRTRAAVPDTVSFAQLKDGAFTVACQKTTGDGRIAKILAGHASGMEDAYVLRNPEIVKPACDAVYAHYGPFPT